MRAFLDISPVALVHFPRTLHRCYRFSEIKSPPFTFLYSDRSDSLKLTVNKPVRLHGVQLFGNDSGQYTVSLEVEDAITGFSLAQKSGSYFSEKDDTHAFYGVDVKFDLPVCIETDRTYEIISRII